MDQSNCGCGSPGLPQRRDGSPTSGFSPDNPRMFSSTGRSPQSPQSSQLSGYNTTSTINTDDALYDPRSPRSIAYEYDEYGNRPPRAPFHSTAVGSNSPPRLETIGSQIDYNLSWMPQDASSPRMRQKDKNLSWVPGDIDTRGKGSPQKEGLSAEVLNLGFAPLPNVSKFTGLETASQTSPQSPLRRSPKQESLLEWFDRSVEKELKKRREGSMNVGENLVNLESPTHVKESLPSPPSNPLILEASASGIEISARLRKEQDTDLLEAVDKLAMAEAMITFEGAVRAAEEAAAAAPPEFAEEAAAAGAQGFQAELTGVVKHEFSGTKPIEVVGYVGITRPRKPKRSYIPRV